jgi:transmembrane sensor
MSTAPTPPRPEGDPSREAIEATAAVWLSLRDRGLSAAETAEFVRWLQLDPRHAAVFEELDRTWKDFDRVAALQPAAPREQPDAELLAPRPRPSRPAHRLGWAAGLAVAAAIAVLVAPRLLAPRHTAETAVGALQKLDLPDGSVALLNTDSAIDTAFTAAERRVRIVRGEVFFTVAKDTARPFVVTAGPVAVRAVGTAFNVHRQNGTVEVLVTEGRVRLTDDDDGRSLLAPRETRPAEPPVLQAGERAVVRTASTGEGRPKPAMATVVPVAPAALQRELAWQERRLEFDEVPLAEIVRQFNRHNRLQLVVDDPRLAQQRFSGVFRADGQESFLRLLQEDFGVQVVRRGREIELRPANRGR